MFGEELLEVEEQDLPVDRDGDAGDGGDGEGGGEQPPAAAKGGGKDETTELLREIKGEVKNLRTRLSEAEEDARYWRSQVRNGGPQEQEDEEPADEDIQVSDDVLEAFSSGDAKRVAKVLKEMGFTRKGDVEAAIKQTRKEITQQGQIYNDYPELADPKSPFFKATAKVYNDLVADDPALKKSPKTIEIAAKLAAKDFDFGDEEAPAPRPSRRTREREYEEEDEDAEFERSRRVASQSGDRGRRNSSSSRNRRDEGGETELSAIQRSIVAKFAAAGSSVTEEGYRKRASAGIRMAGLPSSRRGGKR